MNFILKYGCYIIGSLQRKTFMNINDIFQLYLVQDRECNGSFKEDGLKKTKYNLDDIRDLESKLVLITGNNAEYKERFDIFLNVSVSCVFCVSQCPTFSCYSSLFVN